jgi:hypothetical protein
MSEFVTKFFRGLLLTFADLPTVDDHIASVNIVIDLERAERKRIRELLGRRLQALFFDVTA